MPTQPGYPITFLSEDTSLAEFFHFLAIAKSVRKRESVPTPHGIYAFDLKSPVVTEELGPDGFAPKRLLFYGTTGGAKKVLQHLASLRLPDPSGRSSQGITISFNDGAGCFVELFGEVARANRPALGLALRNPKDHSDIGTIVLVREYAVAAAMQRLGIERWRIHLLQGWAAHNRGRPMRLVRLPPGVSGAQLRDEVLRENSRHVGAMPPALDCAAFSPVLPLGPLLREGMPSRLIIASLNPLLRLPLTRAAGAAGAPQDAAAYHGFELPSDVGQSCLYAEAFDRMERHDLPVVATTLVGPNRSFEETPMLVLARTEPVIRKLTTVLGIGSWENSASGE